MIKDSEIAEKVLQFYEKNSADPKYVYENYTTENTKTEKIKCAICGNEIDFNVNIIRINIAAIDV